MGYTFYLYLVWTIADLHGLSLTLSHLQIEDVHNIATISVLTLLLNTGLAGVSNTVKCPDVGLTLADQCMGNRVCSWQNSQVESNNTIATIDGLECIYVIATSSIGATIPDV